MNDVRRGQPRYFIRPWRAWIAGLMAAMVTVSPVTQSDVMMARGVLPVPGLKAQSAVLMAVVSGRILLALAPDEPADGAVAQRLLTALVAMEESGESGYSTGSRLISVGDRAVDDRAVGDSDPLRLKAGEKLAVIDLVSAVLLVGSGEAALALAEEIHGSEAASVRRLNEKARKIGATATRFLSQAESGGSTTAHDLALIAREAMMNPDLAALVRVRSRVIPWTVSPVDRNLINSNGLLTRYAGADGVLSKRTGHSKGTIVASASREGWQLLAAVLGSGDPEGDAARLLDFGYQEYAPEEVIPGGQIVKTFRVSGGSRKRVAGVTSRSLVIPLAPGDFPKLRREDLLPKAVKAPVGAGDRIGEVRLMLDGEVVGTVQVLAANTIKAERLSEALSPWNRLINLWFRMVQNGARLYQGGSRTRETVYSDGA